MTVLQPWKTGQLPFEAGSPVEALREEE